MFACIKIATAQVVVEATVAVVACSYGNWSRQKEEM